MEEGRFVITKVIVKVPSGDDDSTNDESDSQKKRSVRDTETVVALEPDNLKVISKGVLEGTYFSFNYINLHI